MALEKRLETIEALLVVLVNPSSKHGLDRLLLHARYQMAITPTHVLRGMPDPSIDQTLVHTGCCAVTHKRMPQHVPSRQILPLRSREGAVEMVAGFAPAQ